MTTDLHAQIAALKNKIADLQNQIDEHDIAEKNWQDRERELLKANSHYVLKGRHAEPLAKALDLALCWSTQDDLEAAGAALQEYRKEFPA